MKISQTSSYAIAAMSQIAAQPDGSLVSNATICQAANPPRRYLLILLRELVNAKLLVSVRGVAGGYKLSRPASDITLLDIIEATDGPAAIGAGLERDGLSPDSLIVIERALLAIVTDTRRRLASVKLTELEAV